MSSRGRYIRRIAKFGFDRLHRLALEFGLILLPNHYYVPYADRRQLKRTQHIWSKRAPLHGIDTNLERQLGELAARIAPFEPEFRGNARFREACAGAYGPGFGYVEAQCLHGMIRSLKPRRIIEVGSGTSTHIMLGAMQRNAEDGTPCDLTCIEPFPSAFLKSNREIRLIKAPVQELDPAMFDALESGDLLFIDSTHAVRPGGDVEFLYLSVIPRLKSGIIVHIHDIFFPYLYQRNVLTELYQWSETVLLAALLTGNRNLSILFSLSQIHYDDPKGLGGIFPEYVPQANRDGFAVNGHVGHFPASIYLLTH